MHLKIAIVDDEPADRAYLMELTRRWGEAAGHTLQLETFPSAESFLFQCEAEGGFQILLIDSEIGGMDGVTRAHKVRQADDAVQIIFITGYSDYIAEGYEVEALHYLMKPVDEGKLFSVLGRAAEKLRKNERALTLDLGDETVRLPVHKVRWAEVQGNYVTVHAETGYTVRMTLRELERQLDDRFFRVGRSAVVNLSCITRVTKAAIFLSDGSQIPLPRGAYEKVNRAIINQR